MYVRRNKQNAPTSSLVVLTTQFKRHYDGQSDENKTTPGYLISQRVIATNKLGSKGKLTTSNCVVDHLTKSRSFCIYLDVSYNAGPATCGYRLLTFNVELNQPHMLCRMNNCLLYEHRYGHFSGGAGITKDTLVCIIP